MNLARIWRWIESESSTRMTRSKDFRDVFAAMIKHGFSVLRRRRQSIGLVENVELNQIFWTRFLIALGSISRTSCFSKNCSDTGKVRRASFPAPPFLEALRWRRSAGGCSTSREERRTKRELQNADRRMCEAEISPRIIQQFCQKCFDTSGVCGAAVSRRSVGEQGRGNFERW